MFGVSLAPRELLVALSAYAPRAIKRGGWFSHNLTICVRGYRLGDHRIAVYLDRVGHWPLAREPF